MFSKSQYTKYQHCHKQLWLYKNKRDVMSAPDASLEKIFETGNQVGKAAWQIFPGGALVDEPYYEVERAVAKTRELMKTELTIYEAAFVYDDVLVRVDILHKTKNGWDMYEVKSSTEVKEEHQQDASVQGYVLRGAGVKLNKTYIMHINADYVKDSAQVNPKKLFTFSDITEALSPEEYVKQTLNEMRTFVKGEEPAQEISKGLCGGCEFQAYCWQHVPKNSVYDLPRIGNKAPLIAAHGHLKIEEVPFEYLTSDNQIRWANVFKTNMPYVDKDGIKGLLSQLRYPLYYLDFETTMPAIPIWLNTRPYQQIVFQASLHVQEKEGAALKHYEYLFEGKDDPRPKAAAFLLKHIGAAGTIIAHNAPFEKSRISEMIRDLDLTSAQADALKNMLPRFWDSKDAFQKYYLHPKCSCSASIKKVLPMVAPDMTYEGMQVAHGGDAMNAFDALYEDTLSPEDKAKLKNALLAYCKQDTLAMVKLVDFLRSIVS